MIKRICTTEKNFDNISYIEFVQSQSNYEMREMYDNFMKENLLNKYTFPKKPSSDGYYHIYVNDSTKKGGKTQIKCKTLEGLKEKVYKKEFDNCRSKTFKEVFELMCKYKLSLSFNDRKFSTEKTISNYESTYKRFIKDTAIEFKYIDEITADDIEKNILLNAERYTLNKSSFKALIGLFSPVFKYAIQKKLIIYNPWLEIDLKAYNNIYISSNPISERAHSTEEIDKIIEYLREYQNSKPNYFALYALEFQIMVGCRRGEIPPLRWSDITYDSITFSREQIEVRKSKRIKKSYDKIVNHTKTNKVRFFPLTSELKDLLAQIKRIQKEYNIKSEYIFPANTENGCIKNQTIYYCYKKACEKLGIKKNEGIIKGTHSFRRNRITEVINETGDINFAAEIFGNSPKVIYDNYYLGSNKEKHISALEKRSFGRVTKSIRG